MAKIARYEAGWNLGLKEGRVRLEVEDGKQHLLKTVDPAVFAVVLALLARGDARLVPSPTGPWLVAGDGTASAGPLV